jgi:hypothetical protein
MTWTSAQIVGFWLLANLLAVGAYDLVAMSTGSPTVSMVIRTWAANFVALPFACGMLAGHLFWGPGDRIINGR